MVFLPKDVSMLATSTHVIVFFAPAIWYSMPHETLMAQHSLHERPSEGHICSSRGCDHVRPFKWLLIHQSASCTEFLSAFDKSVRNAARTRGHVDGEELPEVGARVVLGEHGLDGVLEGKIEGLRREVAQHVGQVAAPE